MGRIALIINHAHNKIYSKRVGFFGMFEAINDDRVSDMLFKEAESWCRRKRLDNLLGPVSLSTNHECGLLVEGFDTPPVIGIPYNPASVAFIKNQEGFLSKTSYVADISYHVLGYGRNLSGIDYIAFHGFFLASG